MRIFCGLMLLAVGLTACGDDLPDPPPAAGTSSTGSSASTGTGAVGSTSSSSGSVSASTSSSDDGVVTFGDEDECVTSRDCPAGGLCVAPFDESLGPAGKGLNECVSACVGPMDEARWCADAAACCDPDAECTDRGYCVVPGSSTGSSGSGSGDSGSSTGGSGTSTG